MAYAAVNTLKRTISHRLEASTIDSEIMSSMHNELRGLKEILQRLDETKNRRVDMSAINALDAEIREAVHKLEDVLESYLLNCTNFHTLKQEVVSFLKTANKLGKDYIREIGKPLLPEDDTLTPTGDGFGGGNTSSTTVGLSEQVHEIMKKLLDLQSGPKTVSLLGMAGIGKTHLAREIYQHPSITQHFDFIAWVRVGQKHQMKKIFVDILVQIECKPKDVYVEQDVYTLVVLLQNRLHGLRYLIFLDDVWSANVQDDLIRLLPYNRGSRRLFLTTRLEEVAYNNGKRLGDTRVEKGAYNTSAQDIPFLNNEESWNLLRQNVLADEYCSPQLEKVGRKIAENCEGLPLLILTVADILRGFDKTEEYWNKVADNKTTTFPDAYDRIWDVLFLSYEFLPQLLKPCFLYMGVFPQRFEILRSKLINLWDVEDFIDKSNLRSAEDFIYKNNLRSLEGGGGPTFEELCMDCLQKIVSNSLAIKCKQSTKAGNKSVKIHSAYWHLCVKESRKIKFYHVLKRLIDTSPKALESHRRLSVQNNMLFGLKEVYDSIKAIQTTRSLLFTGEDHQYQVPVCFDLMFLKVLDALSIRFYKFPIEVVKLLQLKYLALTHNGELPSSISNLQLLESLILRHHQNIKIIRDSRSDSLPKEIWDMQELVHLKIMRRNLPDPTNGAELSKLSTLYVSAHSCTEAVFKSLRNLKKLGIHIELLPDAAQISSCFDHVILLNKLESLTCAVVNPRVVAQPHNLSNLPMGLKKLSLNGLGYSWEFATAIGSLPKLQVLKLRCYAFRGPKWKTKVREFQSLKFLLLEDMDLVQWTVENNDKLRTDKKSKLILYSEVKLLPNFQRLIIQNCYKLKEIPSQIGDVPSLKTIEVVDCSPSVVASVQKIQKKRNSSLQVVITSSWN